MTAREFEGFLNRIRQLRLQSALGDKIAARKLDKVRRILNEGQSKGEEPTQKEVQ